MQLTIAEDKIEWPGCEIIADYDDLTPEEWRTLRRSGIGGSDAGACLGLSRYSSPLTVCMDKTGRGEEFDGNEATEVGNILEPLIRDHIIVPYIEEHENIVTAIGEAPHVYRSREWPWMLANIDGYIDLSHQRYGLEIKTGGSYQLREWGGMDGDEIPGTYYAQVQHYMAVTGVDSWLVFGLIGNRRLHRFVRRNDAFIGEMVEREREIWEAIEANDPLHFPAPIGLSAEDAALSVLANPMTYAEVDLSNIADEIDRYYSVSAEIKDMEKIKKEAQQIIKHAMGTAAKGYTDRYTVNRTQYKKQQFEHGRFAKEHPEAIADYMREITIDYPRVKEAK